MGCISIREYDHLLPAGAGSDGPRAHAISRRSFDALLKGMERDPAHLAQALRASSYGGRPSLQAQSYAGVIRTSDGTEIEILPKIAADTAGDDTAEFGRELLVTMLRAVPDMDLIEAGPAGLKLRELPLLEFFISQFLRATSHVVRRGIRHDYSALANSEPFIRGRILFPENVRRNLGRGHLCHNEHDRFLPDCAENRLLRTALKAVKGLTRSSRHLQLTQELYFCFDEVPVCRDVDADLQGCRRDPSMSHYRRALDWAALLLERMRPSPTSGRRDVHSILFAMEDLFECYVYRKLREKYHRADSPVRVRKQLRTKFLTRHLGGSMFLLKPDLALERNGTPVTILDTKWKRLDSQSPDARRQKYGISEADFYQLFAYGRKYLAERAHKTVCLIYPRTERFPSPLAHFDIEDGLRLYVLPFDIKKAELIEPYGTALHLA